MNARNRIGIVLVAALAILALAAPGFAGDDSNMAGTIEAWMTHYNAGELAGVAGLYTEDACRMPPHAATVNGREAIQAALETGREQGVAQVNLGLTMSTSSGDLASATGTFEILDADGNHIDHGKWMNLSTKTADGWKIRCDIWNSDMPMPAADDEDDG